MTEAARAVASVPAPGLAPWLQPYRALVDALGGLDAALDVGVVGPLQRVAPRFADAPAFVPAHEAPAGEPYEHTVHRHGRVPTRAVAHDLLNALVWLRFPALKHRLNALHAAELDREGVRPARGPVRDALTLLDENGLVLAAPDAIADALRRRDWQAAFVTHRDGWRHATPVVVGHALLDKLRTPWTAITAHAWLLPADAAAGHDPAGAVVEALVARLSAEALSRRPFVPLPVLGVPGWWPANEERGFYADARVFRPPRASAPDPGCRRPSRGRVFNSEAPSLSSRLPSSS